MRQVVLSNNSAHPHRLRSLPERLLVVGLLLMGRESADCAGGPMIDGNASC